MTLMEVELGDQIFGLVLFNPEDMNILDIANGSLIEIKDNRGNRCILEAYGNEDVEVDTIVADRNILEDLGIQDEDWIEIDPYDGKIGTASDLMIEFKSIDDNPEEFFRSDVQRELQEFIRQYRFLPQMDLLWPDQNASLTIMVKNKGNGSHDYYKISSNGLNLQLREKTSSMPFNAILLIDKSGSMNYHDVKIDDSGSIIGDLYNNFYGNLDIDEIEYNDLYSVQRNLLEWFKELLEAQKRQEMRIDYKENQSKNKGIRRIDAIILATILFFRLKISRGLGEKCAFVLYSDEAKPVEFDGRMTIEATEFDASLCENLVRTIKDSKYLRYGQTNMSSSLVKCREIASHLKESNNKPLMVLLLTDGRPHPPETDTEKSVISHLKKLKDFLDEEEIPFVLYTLGIGDSKKKEASEFLERLAMLGNGEFHYVHEMAQLIKWR